MNDTYVEQIIKKKTGGSQVGLRVTVIVASILVLYIFMAMVGVIALVPGFFLFYLVYYVFQMTNVEYEYVYVNGDLTVDAIMGGNKRKNVGSFDLSKCELVAPVTSTYAAGYHRNNDIRAYNFTSGDITDEAYIIIVGEGAGHAKVYFEPNEKLIEAMRITLPNKIKQY